MARLWDIGIEGETLIDKAIKIAAHGDTRILCDLLRSGDVDVENGDLVRLAAYIAGEYKLDAKRPRFQDLPPWVNIVRASPPSDAPKTQVSTIAIVDRYFEIKEREFPGRKRVPKGQKDRIIESAVASLIREGKLPPNYELTRGRWNDIDKAFKRRPTNYDHLDY